MDEISLVKDCSDKKQPWIPKDEEKLDEALRVYKRGHPEEDQNPVLNFPWPKPGEIPKVSDNFMEPTDSEKKKIRNFIEKNEGPDMDPLTQMIVELAKDLIQEIH